MSRKQIIARVLAVAVIIALSMCAACTSNNPPSSPSYVPKEPLPEEIIQQNNCADGEAEIYLAGGCFWGMEFLMRNVQGVVSVEVGYANGSTRNPTYRQVAKGSGHAETAHVIYNPEEVSLKKLLDIFYKAIDPTYMNNSRGENTISRRTGIYFSNPNDEPIIRESLKNLQEDFSDRVVVECEPIKNFYRAEENHQEYLLKNPNGYCHVSRSPSDEQSKIKVARSFKNKDFSRSRVYSEPSKDTLEQLSELQRAVTQDSATEPPFKNEYDEEFREGIYVDVTTGQPLFCSKDKFESNCGWPSFSKAIDKNFLVERTDNSFGMQRTEVRVKASGSHLGHVFDDGPADKGGLRYCVNSAALRFIPRENMSEEGYGDWLNLFKD